MESFSSPPIHEVSMECEYLNTESSGARTRSVTISLEESSSLCHPRSASWPGCTGLSSFPKCHCSTSFKRLHTPDQLAVNESIEAPLPSFQDYSLHQTNLPFVTKHSFQGTPLQEDIVKDSSRFLSIPVDHFSIEESPELTMSRTVTPQKQTLFLDVSDSKNDGFSRGKPAMIPELKSDDSQDGDSYHPCLFMRRSKAYPFATDETFG